MDLVVQIEADQVFKKQVRISTGKIGFNNINPGATVKVDGNWVKPLWLIFQSTPAITVSR